MAPVLHVTRILWHMVVQRAQAGEGPLWDINRILLQEARDTVQRCAAPRAAGVKPTRRLVRRPMVMIEAHRPKPL